MAWYAKVQAMMPSSTDAVHTSAGQEERGRWMITAVTAL